MRAFLTKAEAVTETTAAKHKVRPGARNFKSRTLQNIPAQDAADDDLKIPATDRFAMFTFEGDEFRAPGFVTLANQRFDRAGYRRRCARRSAKPAGDSLE